MSEPTLAPVDQYDEDPGNVRSEEETAAAEGRADAVDQIPDYHDEHPTLDTSGPEHDPAVQAKLRGDAAPAPAPVTPVVVDPPGGHSDIDDSLIAD